MGLLYIVSTPIGNLEDITRRALRILSEVDVIAAENPNNSKKLLNNYDIKKRVVSYCDKNKTSVAFALINRIIKGEKVALISDAGTPGISDPGYFLVKLAREKQINVVPVPGVSAPITALSVSGFPTDAYKFIGFLPSSETKKRDLLKDVIKNNITTVFFESPLRIYKTLEVINDLAPSRKIFVGRELTKMFETITVGEPLEVACKLRENEVLGKVKGEITVIVSKGKKDVIESVDELLDIISKDDIIFDDKLSTRDASRIIMDRYNVSRKLAYDASLLIFK